MAPAKKPIVLITGISGSVGEAITRALEKDFQVVGMDKETKGAAAPTIEVDLTRDRSVEDAFSKFRDAHGAHIASVIHLAAYFDFTGEDNPLYHTLNVDGTRRFLSNLQRFHVEQFVYASTMLVYQAVKPGEHITESSPQDPQWIYPKSKAQAEAVIRAEHGAIPYVILQLAGLYDDETVVPTLAHQIARIYERTLEGHLYAGRLDAGQSMVHKDDLAKAFHLAVEQRSALPDATTLLIGEPDPPGYATLQDRLGELIHGEDWATVRIPSTLAATGAWVQDKVLPHLPKALGGKTPFIRPFMALEASDHFALDITRARDLLDWSPSHSILDDLAPITAKLKRDPASWYKANKMEPPKAST